VLVFPTHSAIVRNELMPRVFVSSVSPEVYGDHLFARDGAFVSTFVERDLSKTSCKTDRLCQTSCIVYRMCKTGCIVSLFLFGIRTLEFETVFRIMVQYETLLLTTRRETRETETFIIRASRWRLWPREYSPIPL
jgi:hypothetical protein